MIWITAADGRVLIKRSLQTYIKLSAEQRMAGTGDVRAHGRIQPIMLAGAKPPISSQGRGPKPGAQSAESGDGVLGEGQPARGSGGSL